MPHPRVLLCLLLLTASATPGAANDLGGGTAEVEADRLEVDHGVRKARFEGSVRAVWNDLELRCDAMTVTYDTDGKIVSLAAKGRVSVTRGQARATAASARLDARLGLLVLEGNPVLNQDGHRLTGKRISVRLSDGKLSVNEARGTFRLGGETSR